MLTVVRIIDRDQNRIFCDLKLSISMTNSISYDGPYNGPQYILKISLPGERRHAKFFKQMRSIYPVTISYRKGFEPLICFEDAGSLFDQHARGEKLCGIQNHSKGI